MLPFCARLLCTSLLLAGSVLASPIPESTGSELDKRADSSLVGYLMIHFYDRQPAIFAHLSNGNNPTSFRTLNGDNAILVPTVGSRASRDPYLVSAPDNSKHWILATDLDIVALGNNWDTATRHGSTSLIIWESTDLVHWTNERLVNVAGSRAGMAWAPEAVYDVTKGQYFVHWASRLYATTDTGHTGTATQDQIMYAYTSDFKTFTAPQVYISKSTFGVIDLTILPLDTTGKSFARFWKDENALNVVEERSDTGLFGTWTHVGPSYVTTTISEGPLVFWDNQQSGVAHLFLDQYTTAGGYVSFQTTNINTGTFTRSGTLPSLLKHGVVKPVTQAQYNLILSTWG